jgi:transketolase
MAGPVRRVDGHDGQDVAGALSQAMRSKKPTIIACRTIIGFTAPKKAGTAGSHGAPLGADEIAAAKSPWAGTRRPSPCRTG